MSVYYVVIQETVLRAKRITAEDREEARAIAEDQDWRYWPLVSAKDTEIVDIEYMKDRD